MKKIKLTLASKLVVSIIVAEFFIMAVVLKIPVLKSASPMVVAFVDTIILGVVVIVVAKLTLRPLRDMAMKMEEVRQGKLKVRMNAHGADEIGGIARQINHMLEGVEVSYQKIKESEKLLSTITDGIDEEIMLIDDKFNVLWVNRKTKELSRLEEKEIIGSYCFKLTHHIDEPCKEPLDGCPILNIDRTKKNSSVVHTHFDKEGNPFYVEVIAYPLTNDVGQATKFIHISRDVTARIKMVREIEEAKNKLENYSRKLETMVEEKTNKLTVNVAELRKINDELKRTQAQLLQAGKMAAIGKLAAGVAHEINNPLAAILNNTQLIKIWIDKGKEIDKKELGKIMRLMEDSVVKCNKITRDLLGFSRASTGKFEKFSIVESVMKAVDLVEYEISLENIRIKKELATDIPLYMGDSLAMQQVFLNIIVNSSWAIRKKSGRNGGDILIKSQYDRDNNCICVDISDTGVGIEDENISKIFDAFYTTKEPGEGTGLGLSIVYNTIRRHGGKIEVDSRLNEGTTFKIKLPLENKAKSL